MFKHLQRCCAALVALAAATSAHAVVILFANLTPGQEAPAANTPVISPGVLRPFTTSTGDPRPLSFGTATFVLNDAQTAMSMSATIFNIDVTGTQTPTDTNDNLVAAHIHAPAPPGSAAGVVWGFFGIPDNDNNPDQLMITPFATGVGGTFSSIWDQPEGNAGTNLTAQIPNILAGLSYINFHTVQFPGGEIRGQILPAQLPEPGTLALLGLGLIGFLGFDRLRHRPKTRRTEVGRGL